MYLTDRSPKFSILCVQTMSVHNRRITTKTCGGFFFGNIELFAWYTRAGINVRYSVSRKDLRNKFVLYLYSSYKTIYRSQFKDQRCWTNNKLKSENESKRGINLQFCWTLRKWKDVSQLCQLLTHANTRHETRFKNCRGRNKKVSYLHC